jgi:hypothetical protein
VFGYSVQLSHHLNKRKQSSNEAGKSHCPGFIHCCHIASHDRGTRRGCAAWRCRRRGRHAGDLGYEAGDSRSWGFSCFVDGVHVHGIDSTDCGRGDLGWDGDDDFDGCGVRFRDVVCEGCFGGGRLEGLGDGVGGGHEDGFGLSDGDDDGGAGGHGRVVSFDACGGCVDVSGWLLEECYAR